MSGMVKRTWELGMLAKDAARARLRKDSSAAQAIRAQLAERMAKLGGIPQKVGQILAVMELSNPEPAYAGLLEGKAVLPAEDAHALIATYLGRDLSECYRSVDGDGVSASLAQVHRGILLDGREVAIKVQYPNIAAAVDFDLRALGWLTAPLGGLRQGGFDLSAYQQEVGGMIHRELDYRQEAQALLRFRAWADAFDGLDVPTVIPELSGERILTMTWMEGESFAAAQRWPQPLRDELARGLIRLFLTSCLRWHCLHGDPHPGNYRFRAEGRNVTIGMLDFGCVRFLDDATVGALRALLLGTRTNTLTAQDIFACYAALGFQAGMLVPMAHLLLPLTNVLLEPFQRSAPFVMENWKLGERIAEVLGVLRWNFRAAGPASLIYFIRAFQGLVQYVPALEATVNWRAILDEVDTGARGPVVPSAVGPVSPLVKSQHLRVRVREGGETRVELTFAARAAEDLADLIPPDIEEKLADRAIDVARIARDVVARNFEPGDLFTLTDSGKEVRVWLE